MINLCILKAITDAFTFTKGNIWFLYPYVKSKKMWKKDAGRSNPNISFNSAAIKHKPQACFLDTNICCYSLCE